MYFVFRILQEYQLLVCSSLLLDRLTFTRALAINLIDRKKTNETFCNFVRFKVKAIKDAHMKRQKYEAS